MSCPACDSNSLFVLKMVTDYAIWKCAGCRLEFVYPVPSADELAGFYMNYADPLATEPVANRNALHRLMRMSVRPPSRILDFGCGEGAFVKQAAALGFNVVGEDKYRSIGAEGLFRWITLWGVLEHMTDPFDELCELYQRLEPHGRIALTTVSIETPIPYRHKPPEHTLYFTRAAIAALAERAGFRIIEYRSYRMVQDSDVYLDTLLRTMPDEYQAQVTHSMPKYVEIPTNEVFVVMEKV